MKEEILFATAGFGGEDTLTAYPEAGCGHIKDGVGFAHNHGGAWVIAFADLEKLYLAAKKAREGA